MLYDSLETTSYTYEHYYNWITDTLKIIAKRFAKVKEFCKGPFGKFE